MLNEFPPQRYMTWSCELMEYLRSDSQKVLSSGDLCLRLRRPANIIQNQWSM